MSQSKRRVFVIGVGMTKFERPGSRNWDYPDMGKEAGIKALEDANIQYKEVEQVVVGYVYGDSTCGQRAVYGIGLTGVPIYNVNNNCSTGSTALYMAKQLVEGGIANCVMALGFEKMEKGSLGAKFGDRVNPLDLHSDVMIRTRGFAKAPPAPQMFGNAGREHMEKYGTTKEHFAKIAYKNHKHSVNNPYSQFRDEYSLKQIMESPSVFEPLTKLQCCPTSDGAASAILASEEFVIKHNLQNQAVEIIGMAMATDMESSFQDSCIRMVGFDLSKLAAEKVYQQAGLTAHDAQVIELHDCFSCNELLTYEALGLCPEGKAGQLIDDNQVTYGGKWVVNPSGGLISKGHPLGATGLAQCSELCWQLRGMCSNRQVKNCKVALQHNIGLGGASVVAMYRLGFPEKFTPYPASKHNHAIEAAPSAHSLSMVKPSSQSGQTTTQAAGKVTVPGIMNELSKQIAASNGAFVKSVNGVYQFNITNNNNDNAVWTVDLKNGNGQVKQGAGAEKADCIISAAEEDFIALMTGTVNPQNLFMKGKLKIQGNMSLAMKLTQFQQKSKL